MAMQNEFPKLRALAAALLAGACACQAAAPPADLSGRQRVGKASYYGGKFVGRKMADGSRMDPHQDNAASKTLPLGTTAKVTNLATGQSTVVTIKDRGPYVKGRIVDLTPSTARKVGITPENGVAPVAVTPIAVPLPDGRIKPGEAAGAAPPASPATLSRASRP
ncbi:MAG TPA: septal ring lytic transglycosylase RlpA family protein [Burkholderiaceae bacterium]|jgi:rare lipoprotein A